MTVVVSLSLATICFLGHCHPALVGANTPVGAFPLQHRMVVSPGYGGDVLSFSENAESVLAIHRVWTLRPREHRPERLSSGRTSDRKLVTGGCINVSPEVYAELVDCCSRSEVQIVG